MQISNCDFDLVLVPVLVRQAPRSSAGLKPASASEFLFPRSIKTLRRLEPRSGIQFSKRGVVAPHAHQASRQIVVIVGRGLQA